VQRLENKSKTTKPFKETTHSKTTIKKGRNSTFEFTQLSFQKDFKYRWSKSKHMSQSEDEIEELLANPKIILHKSTLIAKKHSFEKKKSGRKSSRRKQKQNSKT